MTSQTSELVERAQALWHADQLRSLAHQHRKIKQDGLSSIFDGAATLLERLSSSEVTEPIRMVLYCPQCGQQHIDAPDERTPDWTNPPHRSHLCHDCGCIWRPADVPTEGVGWTETTGKADTWTPERGNAEAAMRSAATSERKG